MNLRNTQRMESVKSLNRDTGKNTTMFFSIDFGPNSSDLVVTNCSIFGRLRVKADVAIEIN